MSTSMEKPTHHEKPKPHLRPARLGDICVLLEPTQQEEINRLRQRQLALQSSFGGTPIELIHLTCQRFDCQDEHQIQKFQTSLSKALVDIKPISMTALSLQPLYSQIRRTNILKWSIKVTRDLRQFVALVERKLVSVGIEPLYTPGFVSSLIAALKGVGALDDEQLARYGGFPHHLFTGEQIELSRILGPNEFETLAMIPI